MNVMTERMVMEIPIRVTLSIRYASQHGPLGDAVLAFGEEGSPGRRIGSASSPSLYREGRDANKPQGQLQTMLHMGITKFLKNLEITVDKILPGFILFLWTKDHH